MNVSPPLEPSSSQRGAQYLLSSNQTTNAYSNLALSNDGNIEARDKYVDLENKTDDTEKSTIKPRKTPISLDPGNKTDKNPMRRGSFHRLERPNERDK
jgi:hypothetical protein